MTPARDPKQKNPVFPFKFLEKLAKTSIFEVPRSSRIDWYQNFRFSSYPDPFRVKNVTKSAKINFLRPGNVPKSATIDFLRLGNIPKSAKINFLRPGDVPKSAKIDFFRPGNVPQSAKIVFFDWGTSQKVQNCVSPQRKK